MIRYTIITIIVASLAIYSFHDWYKSLCGLIVLMGVFQHPDIRGPMLGIQGFNLWNILFATVVIAWFFSRNHEGLTWDMPRRINILIFLYITIIAASFFRMLGNQETIVHYAIITQIKIPTTAYLWSEYFVNALKWIVPGLLLFDGCRSRSRFQLGILAILTLYLILAIQVIKWMPLSAITSGNDLSYRASKILLNEVGFSRVNLSMMLAGASWSFFAATVLLKRKYWRLFLIFAGLTAIFAQLLTGGRAGYVAWAAVGLILSAVRWKKNFILMPAVVLIFLLAVPGVAERMERGFNPGNIDSNPLVEETTKVQGNDFHWYTITSGRNVAWPYVTEKISESPWLGYGGLSMQALGISAFLQQTFLEDFTHPHNAYLECLLDNGWIGLICIMLFYMTVLKLSISLLRDFRSPVFIAIGGIAFSLTGVLLVASLGAQTFYPREGAVGMWCAIGLMLRVHVQRNLTDAVSNDFDSIDIDETLWNQNIMQQDANDAT